MPAQLKDSLPCFHFPDDDRLTEPSQGQPTPGRMKSHGRRAAAEVRDFAPLDDVPQGDRAIRATGRQPVDAAARQPLALRVEGHCLARAGIGRLGNQQHRLLFRDAP